MSPSAQSADSPLSWGRALALVPTFYGSLLVGSIAKQALGIPAPISREVTAAIMFASMFAWWLVVAAPRPPAVRATMGRPLELADCGRALVAGLAVSCLGFVDLMSTNFGELWRAAQSGGTATIRLTGRGPGNWLGLLNLVVVAPLVEELVFRRTLFRAWRARYNPIAALLASSVVFGVLHQLAVVSFIAGVTFALLYTRTRSLWTSVLAHGVTNGCAAALGGLHYFWASPQLVLGGTLAYCTFALSLLIALGAWLHFMIGSWRTLDAPLSPDSQRATSAA